MPLIIFGGLFINLKEIPAYFLWYSVFSFVQYGEEGLFFLWPGYLPAM